MRITCKMLAFLTALGSEFKHGSHDMSLSCPQLTRYIKIVIQKWDDCYHILQLGPFWGGNFNV